MGRRRIPAITAANLLTWALAVPLGTGAAIAAIRLMLALLAAVSLTTIGRNIVTISRSAVTTTAIRRLWHDGEELTRAERCLDV